MGLKLMNMNLFKNNNSLFMLFNIVILSITLYWLYDSFSYIPDHYLNQYLFYEDSKLPSSKFRNLLLCSNSTMPVSGEHLGHARTAIKKMLNECNVNEILIVTYAYPDVKGGVATNETTKILNEKIVPSFEKIGIRCKILDVNSSPEHQQNEIKNAQSIYMTGGNTFWITRALHQNKVIEILRQKVDSGMPYIGVSSGTNVTSPTMQTTNDMPLCCVPSCDTLGLIPFQLNVHFSEWKQGKGFSGESRTQRLCQYIQENRKFKNTNIPTFVLGLQEGTCLHVSGNTAEIIGFGNRPAVLMQIIDGKFTKKYIHTGTRVDKLLRLDANV